MRTDRNVNFCLLGIYLVLESVCCAEHAKADSALLTIDKGTIKIGIDGDRGGAITWLSSHAYKKNMVNIADPGRLIQQSYYAGKRLDRTSTGQSPNWSPWSWNPIQGGGMGSWAKASEIKQVDKILYSETTPKLWDMPNEKAQALMRQWTTFEALVPNAVVVKCEFLSLRVENDPWGGAIVNPQEVPACYFTRSFATVKSYLGDGQWRQESQAPGPPWGKADPTRKSMACFDAAGHGVAIFSPSATEPWNFGPHGGGLSDDPTASQCMHVASIDRVKLGPKSTYRYRYWIVVGEESEIAATLDLLWKAYAGERAVVTQRITRRQHVSTQFRKQSDGVSSTPDVLDPLTESAQEEQADAGFIQMFDGKTLQGWAGDPPYWSVRNGSIVGELTPETIIKQNRFLIYQNQVPADFEFLAEYRISKLGNSGVNYRSERVKGVDFHALRGYQCDIDGRNRYTGSNYEERGRNTLASVGQVVLLPPSKTADRSKLIKNNRWTAGILQNQIATKKELLKTVHPDKWNTVRIVAKGNVLKHYINGQMTSKVIDNDPASPQTGKLGVQVHVGPPMTIEYRNLRLRSL